MVYVLKYFKLIVQLCSLIVLLTVVLRRTIVDSSDWCSDNLSRSRYQSWVINIRGDPENIDEYRLFHFSSEINFTRASSEKH